MRKLSTGWRIDLHSYRPGALIGRGGETAVKIRDDLMSAMGVDALQLNIDEHFPDGRCAEKVEDAEAS